MEFNLFVPNAHLLSLPPEDIRQTYGFLILSGGRERMNLEQMVDISSPILDAIEGESQSEESHILSISNIIFPS